VAVDARRAARSGDTGAMTRRLRARTINAIPPRRSEAHSGLGAAQSARRPKEPRRFSSSPDASMLPSPGRRKDDADDRLDSICVLCSSATPRAFQDQRRYPAEERIEVQEKRLARRRQRDVRTTRRTRAPCSQTATIQQARRDGYCSREKNLRKRRQSSCAVEESGRRTSLKRAGVSTSIGGPNTCARDKQSTRCCARIRGSSLRVRSTVIPFPAASGGAGEIRAHPARPTPAVGSSNRSTVGRPEQRKREQECWNWPPESVPMGCLTTSSRAPRCRTSGVADAAVRDLGFGTKEIHACDGR